jgi:hypothetical protein
MRVDRDWETYRQDPRRRERTSSTHPPEQQRQSSILDVMELAWIQAWSDPDPIDGVQLEFFCYQSRFEELDDNNPEALSLALYRMKLSGLRKISRAFLWGRTPIRRYSRPVRYTDVPRHPLERQEIREPQIPLQMVLPITIQSQTNKQFPHSPPSLTRDPSPSSPPPQPSTTQSPPSSPS